ncbi:MAG: polysulfide reductase [Deltaproteobacteria bacterium]|nr:MAG: polysulfide reductase [Deltaproteobacteria bacterium]
MAPSSTFFTASPQWHWTIITYFFIGGLAGGCYVLAVLIDLFGRLVDRPLARLGYGVAFPAIVLSGLLLMLDLGRPERFWHMLIESHTFRPMLKSYSPMSFGSWILLAFGGFALLSVLAALAEAGRIRWTWPLRLRAPGPLGTLVSLVGGLLGFFVTGYTGVLLAVTNRPIWSDTPLLGLTFVISAASSSAALLILLAHRRYRTPGLAALERFDMMVLALEPIAIIALIVSLGSVARVWLSVWGLLLLLVVVLGILVPLALQWRSAGVDTRPAVTAALLVLIGGLVLRTVIVLSADAARVVWRV